MFAVCIHSNIKNRNEKLKDICYSFYILYTCLFTAAVSMISKKYIFQRVKKYNDIFFIDINIYTFHLYIVYNMKAPLIRAILLLLYFLKARILLQDAMVS